MTARTQDAYEKSIKQLFESLNRVETLLETSGGPYLLGRALTEVDIRLYPTIIRFDVVYVSVCFMLKKSILILNIKQLFKTNLETIRTGFPYIHKWLRHLYWDLASFHNTTNFEHIKKHYFTSITPLNPSVSR